MEKSFTAAPLPFVRFRWQYYRPKAWIQRLGGNRDGAGEEGLGLRPRRADGTAVLYGALKRRKR